MLAQLWMSTPLWIFFLATDTRAFKISSVLNFDPWHEEPSEAERAFVLGLIKNQAPLMDELNAEIADGFSSCTSKLPPADFETRLAAIFQRGKADPAHAEIVAGGLNRGGGFASHVNVFINELAMAMYFDKSFVHCSTGFNGAFKTEFMKEVFADYYSINFPVSGGLSNCGAYTAPGRQMFAPNFMKNDFDYITELKRFLHKSVMTLKPEVLAEVDSHLAQAGYLGVPYLGVHVRHGDKAYELVDHKLLPMQTYANAIKPLLLKHGLKKVWIASDDPVAGKRMRELLNGVDVTVWQNFTNTSADRKYHNKDVVMPFLVDMEALKRSTVYVGTHSSNIGPMIFYERPATALSISLDVPWNEIPYIGADAER